MVPFSSTYSFPVEPNGGTQFYKIHFFFTCTDEGCYSIFQCNFKGPLAARQGHSGVKHGNRVFVYGGRLANEVGKPNFVISREETVLSRTIFGHLM